MNQLDTDRLRADLHHVVEDVERVLQSAASATGGQVDELKTRAGRRLHAARERLSTLEADAAARARDAARRGNAYAHGNPWKVAGVAAAAAFVVGWLASRR